MPALQPFLLASLRNFEAYQLCKTAVGTVSDISRAIEARLTPYCDDIVGALVAALRDESVDRTVKPPVIQCFGEIAMAIGGAFENYLNFAIMLLLQASGTTADENDDDMVDYVNQLRETILEAYTGIFQGLRDGNLLNLLKPYLGGVLQFLELLAMDQHRDDLVLGRAVGLIGDISQMMGSAVRAELTKDYVKLLIQEALQSGDETVNETARWTLDVVNEVIQAN
jgi:importin subunit beta-1